MHRYHAPMWRAGAPNHVTVESLVRHRLQLPAMGFGLLPYICGAARCRLNGEHGSGKVTP